MQVSQTMRPESGFRSVPNWPYIRKMTMTSQFANMTSSSIFFWRCFVSLVKFSYWSKFHVNIITGSGVMTIFFYKGLTRNLEIGNTPVWVLPNIWRLGQVRDIKFDMNLFNEKLLNAAKCQELLPFLSYFKGIPKREVKIPSPPRSELKFH